MRSNAPNTQTCLFSVYCACYLMDGAVSATCTAKRARPASQASGQAPDRPRRPLGRPPLCPQSGPSRQAAAGERRESAGTRTCEPGPRLIGVGLYFAVKGLNFFRYFAGKGAKFRENFRNFVEISNFLARTYAHGALYSTPLSLYLPHALSSQNEIPRFVPL